MNIFYGNVLISKLLSESAFLFERDNDIFQAFTLQKRQSAKKHVLAPAVIQRLDDMENGLRLFHRFRYR